MQDIHARLTNHIASILGVEKCAIFLYDEETNALVCQAPAYGVPEEMMASLCLPLNEGSIARLLWESAEPFVSNDVMADPRLEEYRPQLAALQLWSILARDFRIEGRHMGTIVAGNKLNGAGFEENDVQLLTLLVEHAAFAIENARLYARAEERAAELALLLDAVTTFSSTLAIDEALMALAEQMVSALKITLCCISLLDEAGQCLKMRAAFAIRNLGWELRLGRAIRLADAPFHHRVIEERTPLVFRQDQPRQMVSATELEAGLMPGIQSGVLLPLLVGERTLGVVSLGELRRWDRTPFTTDKLRLCQAIASQAAIAIERAELYQMVLEEKRKAETILQETFGGIIVIAPDMTIAMINRGAETILGYDAADLVGCRLSELIDSESWDESGVVQRAIETGERVPPQETKLLGRWGRRDVLMGVTPLHDTEGQIFGYLVSLADITHLKEVDRLKSEIVANVSHELRTPLASIKAYTELLLDELDEDDPQLRSQFLGIIDQETDRLTTLISDLLDLSRLEAGRFEMQRELLRLENLIEDVLSLLRLEAQVKGLDIRVQVAENVPLFWGDRELMTTLIKNLVSNAVKFSHPGGQVDIEVTCGEFDLVLVVADQGIGIPEEAIPHLFEKFYRVRSTTESGIEGTGLGLVLARQAAEAHGGTIEVESELGRGSRFVVRLPLSYEGTSPSAPPVVRARRGGGEEARYGTKR